MFFCITKSYNEPIEEIQEHQETVYQTTLDLSASLLRKFYERRCLKTTWDRSTGSLIH